MDTQTDHIEKRDYLLSPGAGLPLHAILIEICAKHNLTVHELRSERKARPLARARQEFFWRAKLETEASLPGIGRMLNRDHTTVLYGIREHERRLAEKAGA